MTTFEEIGGVDALSLFDGSTSETVTYRGRWTEYVTSVVEVDGKFYSVDWERGLTEYQENEYMDDKDEVKEVFPQTEVRVSANTVYLDSPPGGNEEEGVIVSDDVMKSFEVLGLGDAVKNELVLLRDLNLGEVAESLENLDLSTLKEDSSFYAYFEATKKFLNNFK